MTARVAKKTVRRVLRVGLQRSTQPLPARSVVQRAQARLRKRAAREGGWHPEERVRITVQELLEILGADDHPDLLLQDPDDAVLFMVSAR